jgi:hypothetical protein
MKLKGSGIPVLADVDLLKFDSVATFSEKLDEASKLSTLAIERTVARGYTRESVRAAAVLLKKGDTQDERLRGLHLLVQHLRSPRAEVVAAASVVIKSTRRRGGLDSAAVGAAIAEARKARLASRAS